MNLKKLLRQSIDLHVHIGPEIIPRKYSLPDLVKTEGSNLKAIGIKNHFFPTISMTSKNISKKNQNFIIHSVVLNRFVGGFNADVIRASAQLTPLPIIVWFPTIHAQNVLNKQKYEIPSEWVSLKGRSQINNRLSKTIGGLSVLVGKTKLKNEVKNVLKAIKDMNAILATGHLSWKETQVLVRTAINDFGIKKVIITHPIYQKINMPITVQRELVSMGALIEVSFSMYSIDKISIKKIVKQIKAIGASHCILTSDVGQTFSPSPSQALLQFASLLKEEGVTDSELKHMLSKNPKGLLS